MTTLMIYISKKVGMFLFHFSTRQDNKEAPPVQLQGQHRTALPPREWGRGGGGWGWGRWWSLAYVLISKMWLGKRPTCRLRSYFSTISIDIMLSKLKLILHWSRFSARSRKSLISLGRVVNILKRRTNLRSVWQAYISKVCACPMQT